MPIVTAPSRGQSSGEGITEFLDTVSTVPTTYTFQNTQEKLKVKNNGYGSLKVTVNGALMTLFPTESKEFYGSIDSFVITSDGGVQSFEVVGTNYKDEEFQLTGSYLKDGGKYIRVVQSGGDVAISKKTDFFGKVAGSTTVVPHKAYWSFFTGTLPVPSNVAWTEFDQTTYGNIASQDGTVAASGTNTNGQSRGHKFSMDVLTFMKNTQGSGVTEVTSLRSLLSSISLSYVGWGKGVSGGTVINGVVLKVWNKTTNAYDSVGTNSAGAPTAVSATITAMSDYIDDSGFVHIVSHETYPSDGATSAYLNSDYVSLTANYVSEYKGDASGNETLAVASSSVGFSSIPAAALGAVITVETADIRYWVNSTAPTTTNGHLIKAGGTIELSSASQVKNFKAISLGGTTATLQISYF